MDSKSDIVKCLWGDFEDEDKVKDKVSQITQIDVKLQIQATVKISYASIVSKGVGTTCEYNSENDNSENEDSENEKDDSKYDSKYDDFTLVSKKTKQKKFENVVMQWAEKHKTEFKCTEQLTCAQCNLCFFFGGKTKKNYIEKGWKTPRICKVCSQKRYNERKNVW